MPSQPWTVRFMLWSPLPTVVRKILPTLTVVCFVLTSVSGLRFASSRLSDFAGYYTASKVVAHGETTERLYDDHWFQDQLRSFGMNEPTIVMFVNPPAASFFLLGLQWLPPFAAKVIWGCISILLALGSGAILIRIMDIPRSSGFRSLVVLFCIGTLPFLRNIQLGQVYVVVSFLFIVMFWSYRERKPLLTAVLLSTLIFVKLYGWMFLVLFAAQKRWKELGYSALFLLAWFVTTLPIFGFDAYFAQMQKIETMQSGSALTSIALRSVAAPINRMFFYDPVYNPGAAIHLPFLQTVIPLLLMMVGLWITVQHEGKNETLAFAIITLLSVLFTPLAADHHYQILVLPTVVLVSSVEWEKLNRPKLVGYAVLLYCLFGWLPGLPQSYTQSWGSLLANPRLGSAIVLCYLLMRSLQSTSLISTTSKNVQ